MGKGVERFHVIIEHPRRGVLRDLELDFDELKARFQWSGARNDPEKSKIYFSLKDAFRDYDQIPTPTRWECYIAIYNPIEHQYYKLVKM